VTIDVVTIGDVPATTMPPHNFLALLRTTRKHLYTCPEDLVNFKVMLKMAHLVSGGEDEFRRRPFMTTTVSPTSPVRLTQNCCDLIIAGALAGSPVHSVNMSLGGATAPITNAAGAALTWAELLASLVLAQVVAKGIPVILSTCSTIMDMKTGLASVGAPEFGMIGAAIAELLQEFQLYGYVGGGVSDAKIPDSQAAYEFCQTATLAALSGAPLVFGAGSLEGGLTFDLAKLLLDHEAMDNIHRMMNGIDCSEGELALNLIDEIGPGQQFMTHRHTFQRARTLSQGQLFDRATRGKWEAAGAIPAHERAYAQALNIIENHNPAYLDPGIEGQLREIIAENDAKNG
jgi:trimethylamine--corrinoid protein Co-methyltransferase